MSNKEYIPSLGQVTPCHFWADCAGAQWLGIAFDYVSVIGMGDGVLVTVINFPARLSEILPHAAQIPKGKDRTEMPLTEQVESSFVYTNKPMFKSETIWSILYPIHDPRADAVYNLHAGFGKQSQKWVVFEQ